MKILPAIDLKDGACVRLNKGDFGTVHRVADDAVEAALGFAAAGAKMVHMVDLDGAKDGVGKNGALVRAVAEKSGLQVELGGGLRSMEALERADAMGVYRMVLGSAAVNDPEFLRAAVVRYKDRIAVGIDAKDGMVRTAGWTEDAGLDYHRFARIMESFGVKTIIFTDIDTDGMLSGPSYERLAALRRSTYCNLIASGGVTTLEDVRRLRDLGMDGAIIGKALYAGTIDLKEAVREAGEQC
ncbi:1-(5-phosphoribosyl)-5-[(5-phosphoribosylamino)methylideneamino]imidazole-4-carboxamide isomerase [Papillibacter cinnamivorans]|uniref:1-(5-phosphoribosyl)-5-[(5-phosphoribosylamino)methylideneamino] imidazole-4-carboxamide isomerase n=1 Tax=Papillibacter cinnamivorans DSM 12816 TaxID=1122930 RepID=A0A1W1YLZ5_9FIRM|nr:1-(5-phosphoribosyl)-5-[(5-phosphoribosylamino)methylideneamino]imidazole-4-carboxamide isomerase [Papillibacter cinnamivorans]SMC37152.1 1-(5-phosphoribosyl)-5-[(5-phosphoribosylamino)methylideneamino] imidazole-4-carboxamide isomerase [Papillibacter cinnamivorans DSM 12816]